MQRKINIQEKKKDKHMYTLFAKVHSEMFLSLFKYQQ